MSKGSLILVGADKGGVGKTMISRLLIDWIVGRAQPFNIYDTEAGLEGKTSLQRFKPIAKLADVATVAGQMQIFDGLSEGGMTLVDMRAGQLSNTLRTMRNAGLLDKADVGRVHMAVIHVLGASTQSMSEVVDVAEMLGGDSAHVLMENKMSDGQFFKWDENTRAALFKSVSPAAHIEIPHLDSQAAEDVDKVGVGFNDYVSRTEGSDYLRRLVRFWMKISFKAFDDAALSKIIGL